MQEVFFADNLTAFKSVAESMKNETALCLSSECQNAVHRWGDANGVSFDSSKESFHVLSRRNGWGELFKLLGVTFDSALSMDPEIHSLVQKCSWKVRTLLRAKKFYTVKEVIIEYKARVLSFLEYRTPAIYHAAGTLLHCVDNLQEHFLRELGVSSREALLLHNLAPLSSRRDIAMLGLIEKSVLGHAHPDFSTFFTLVVDAPGGRTRS